jgi:transcriptional regulator with XRE-family HTH domain
MPGPTRRRQTEVLREAQRRTTSIALTLGSGIKRDRLRRRLTQRELSAEIEIDQTRLSQIERGLGHGVPLETWVALGVALDRPLAISFSKPVGPEGRLADAGHLEMQEALLELAAQTGRRATAELPTRRLDPRALGGRRGP